MPTDPITLVAAIVLALLTALLRRKLAGLARHTRDLITLRMVLRDSDPGERVELLAAHRKWRAEPTTRPNSVAPSRRNRDRATRAPSKI
ncbi:hypothetical protein DIZ27_37375 [Streptomyces sp. NWU339]|uniref:hypothetical protein n=1 Tax=Streptomyces sp. NWU339 TaxID=2185284 RepID=UPI000D682E82|nr:hypothetical protein [Streptomyces sp. NWU339]PWI05759.1 hypothetical protein DIZ27_37375 [Streptomyces sp. NWU339]